MSWGASWALQVFSSISDLYSQDASIDSNEASNQKILVLAFWCGRIQAEHMGVVRKTTEFYYRKGGRDNRWVSSRWNGGTVWRKEEKDFILGYFNIILNLKVGEKIHVTPHLQWPLCQERS
jgi:hypothetical protein